MVFFDPDTVKDDEYEKIPDGHYRLMVDNSEYKHLKSGKGRGLSLRFVVLDGPHKGRKLFANFNIEHENPVAANIGKAELKRLLAAIGHTDKIQYENDLHRIVANKVVYGDVVTDGAYQNVKNFSNPNAQAAPSRPAAQAATQMYPASDLDKVPF